MEKSSLGFLGLELALDPGYRRQPTGCSSLGREHDGHQATSWSPQRTQFLVSPSEKLSALAQVQWLCCTLAGLQPLSSACCHLPQCTLMTSEK